jgi:hypothetical protein
MHKPPVMLQYYKRSEMAEIEYRVVRRSKSWFVNVGNIDVVVLHWRRSHMLNVSVLLVLSVKSWNKWRAKFHVATGCVISESWSAGVGKQPWICLGSDACQPRSNVRPATPTAGLPDNRDWSCLRWRRTSRGNPEPLCPLTCEQLNKMLDCTGAIAAL